MNDGADPRTAPPALGDVLAPLLVRLQQTGSRELLAATVALLCRERDQGHVCVSLRDWQRQTIADHAPFPDHGEWTSALLATGLCSTAERGERATPLVLRDGRLYLRRHFDVERKLVDFLRARLAAPPLSPPDELRRALAAIGWCAPDGGAVDWQLAAAAAIANRSFAVLCGGPGTGKTTTVARTLAVLHHLNPALRVALAAPTGKAAARLGEALRAQNFTATVEPTTLHRLLGYLAHVDSFRRGADDPLPHDLVVVDEASMVDPAILAQLCTALRPDARLLLVGDKDQLAAIAAGHVLGELCRAAMPETGVGAELAAFVQRETGMKLPVRADAPPIANATVLLRDNHRFGQKPGIGTFAAALSARARRTEHSQH